MNLFESAPSWLILLFGALLLAAAIEDVIRLRISNLTVLAVLGCGVGAMIASGLTWAMWQNLLVFALLLIAGTFLFASGKFGGGDVKLFAAVGLWANLAIAPLLLASILITGGVLALIVIFARRLARRRGRSDKSSKSAVLPYGVAIAVGALITIAVQRFPQEERSIDQIRSQPLPTATKR